MDALMYICMGLCVVLGIPVTLLWWRDADRWADAEHKRFKPRPAPPQDLIVVRDGSPPERDPTSGISP